VGDFLRKMIKKTTSVKLLQNFYNKKDFCIEFAGFAAMQKQILLLLIPFLFSACKKEESPAPTDPDRNGTHFPGPKAQTIISKEWKLTDKTVDYSNGLPGEDFSNVPDCVKDNIIAFAQNKKYTIDESVDVCPNEPQTSKLDWATEDNEQTLVLNNRKWQLQSISQNTMVLKEINDANPNLTVTTVETYTAQ
jgi:hypothetical protein